MAIAHIILAPATPEQIAEMLQAFGELIKLAVDVEKEILAGGGYRHADCESLLLQDGSKQEKIGGADWYPDQSEVRFEALINIRPNQNNSSMMILDPVVRTQVEKIVRHLLEKP
jgi:hypothetical protein